MQRGYQIRSTYWLSGLYPGDYWSLNLAWWLLVFESYLPQCRSTVITLVYFILRQAVEIFVIRQIYWMYEHLLWLRRPRCNFVVLNIYTNSFCRMGFNLKRMMRSLFTWFTWQPINSLGDPCRCIENIASGAFLRGKDDLLIYWECCWSQQNCGHYKL